MAVSPSPCIEVERRYSQPGVVIPIVESQRSGTNRGVTDASNIERQCDRSICRVIKARGVVLQRASSPVAVFYSRPCYSP